MSKPKIYAHCEAGCEWETVHKSDFEKSAAFIEVPVGEDGFVALELGKTYRLRWASSAYDDNPYLFPIWSGVADMHYMNWIQNSCTAIVCFNDDYVEGSITNISYEMNYEQRDLFHSDTFPLVHVVDGKKYIELYNITEAYLVNTEAEIVGKEGKSAYEVACDNGFEGTEEEWLASLKGEQGEKGADGVSPELAPTLDGNEEDKAPSVKAVNEGLSGKVDADYANDGYPRLYGKKSNGDQTEYTVTTTNFENNVPLYAKKDNPNGNVDKGGVLITSTPNKPYQCANMKYVDDSIAPIKHGVVNALGTQYITETVVINDFIYTFPSNALPFAYVNSANVTFYNESGEEIGTGKVTGMLLSDDSITPITEGEFVQIPVGGSVAFQYDSPSDMYDNYFDISITLQTKVGA